jgi:hypothetical protein
VVATLVAACSTSSGPDQPDAAEPACIGDFVEADDLGNGDLGAPDESGLVIATGETRRICGAVDGAFATGDHGDFDLYTIDIAEPLDLRLDLLALSGDRAPGLRVGLWTGAGQPIGSGEYRGGYAIAGAHDLPQGRYLVSVRADSPGPDEPVPYTLVVRQAAIGCPPYTDTDYAESTDGLDSRGNDVVAVHHGSITEFAATGFADTPEPSGMVLESGDIVGLEGTSADILSAGDSYRDRDSYAFSIGESVNELVATVIWPDAVDLDVFVFEAGSIDRDITGGLATRVGTVNELFEVSVEPGSDLIVWVGQSLEGPQLETGYRLTLCPRRFIP